MARGDEGVELAEEVGGEEGEKGTVEIEMNLLCGSWGRKVSSIISMAIMVTMMALLSSLFDVAPIDAHSLHPYRYFSPL